MKKVAVLVGVVILTAAAIIYLRSLSGGNAIQIPAKPEAAAPSAQPPITTSAAQPPASLVHQAVVVYNGWFFSPAAATINKGGSVVFKNQSSVPLRVASNPHPVHTGYPTTGGCVGSTFDSCADINPGDSWTFTFNIAGTWGYHNHLNPAQGGAVVVK